MFGQYYKGFFINGCVNKEEVTVVFYKGGMEGTYKSVHAAKCAISKKKCWPRVDV